MFTRVSPEKCKDYVTYEVSFHGGVKGDKGCNGIYFHTFAPKEIEYKGRADVFGDIRESTRIVTPQRLILETRRCFYTALEKSIKEEGLRNPVLVWYLDKPYVIYGASRVYTCRKIGAEVKAIVCSFSDFRGDTPITTEEQMLSYFTDPPAKYEFEENYCNFSQNLWWADHKNLKQHDMVTSTEYTYEQYIEAVEKRLERLAGSSSS